MYNNAYYVLDLYKEWWCATIADNVMEMFFLKYTVFYFIQQENAGRRILPFSLNS